LVVPNLFGTKIFQPNKFGYYQLTKQFSISNVTAVSTADVAMERSNMAPRANPNINPYLMDLSVGPNLFGTCFFSQINLAATNSPNSFPYPM